MNTTTESVNVSLPQEEDLLIDLVTDALEKNGTLAKIRAQIRANLFLILDDENNPKHRNTRLQEVLSTQDGILTLLLVQELFDFCDLKESRNIFNAETGGNKTYIYENRSNVSQYFSFAKPHFDDKVPLLVHLVKLLLKLLQNKRNNEDLDSEKEKSLNESETSQKTGPNNTFVVNSGRSDNYDLSFTSESSGATEDRNRLVLELNLNNLSDNSYTKETSDGEKSSTVVINKPEINSASTSISVSPRSEIIEEIIKSDNEKSNKALLQAQALDSSKSEDSIPEEIVKSENNGHDYSQEENDNRVDSPPPNILDLSIPETHSTKMKVKERINNLKHQSDMKINNTSIDRLLKLTDTIEIGAREKTKTINMNGVHH